MCFYTLIDKPAHEIENVTICKNILSFIKKGEKK